LSFFTFFPFSKKAGADETHVRMIKPVIARCGMGAWQEQTHGRRQRDTEIKLAQLCLIGHSIA
jgi:hypothetical protein